MEYIDQFILCYSKLVNVVGIGIVCIFNFRRETSCLITLYKKYTLYS